MVYSLSMILPIYTLPQSVLRQKAAKVTNFDDALHALIADMFETMHGAIGIGLAAPQVGVSKAVAVLEYIDDEDVIIPRTVLVNPRVTWSSAQTSTDEEACLSIPGVAGNVKRPREIRVKAENEYGETITIEADGLYARALQHEIDHLNGVLFTDGIPKQKLMQRPIVSYPTV
jgi:peptide deformylase